MASRKQQRLPAPGTLAPGFLLSALDGTEVALSELIANGPVLLAFFKITCPVCQMTMPFLDRLHHHGSLPVYAISQNAAPETREFNQHFGVTLPTLLDSEDAGYPASNAYGISSVPTSFLIEPNGTISLVIEGWNRIDMESLGARAGTSLFRPEDNVPAWKAG
jgi:peroxiredoxin